MKNSKSTGHIKFPPGLKVGENGTKAGPKDGPAAKDSSIDHEDVVKNGPIKPEKLSENHVTAKRLNGYSLILDQYGVPCIVTGSRWNRRTLRIGSPEANKVIRQHSQKRDISMTRRDIAEFNDMLHDQAEAEAKTVTVYHRVAPRKDGIEIDIGDEKHTRIFILPRSVEIVVEGSESYFHRSKPMQSLVIPAETGDLARLRKYINVNDVEYILVLAWITYTIAHPKIATSNYVHLVLIGGQGVGKSTLSQLIIKIVDPSIIGVQVLPGNPKDLAIAAKFSHLLCYDNIRAIKQSISDAMCIAATGGALSSRALYTDDTQHIIYLHCPLVLNGLHEFLTEPDLAQRSLPIRLSTIDEKQRKSELEMEQELDQDLPFIMRGLYDLIAAIFDRPPDAEVTNPERMIDFVRWLAALESIHNVPVGVYQSAYSVCLRQAQLDSLLENPLAAAVVGFAEELKSPWEGEPTALLQELGYHATSGIQRSSLWPRNANSMSKRLQSFQAALKSQGIYIDFSRSKKRRIAISTSALDERY